MIREVLLKIETLHSFVEDCIESGSISLIDKDIILQNLRDTYLLASTMELEIDENDDFDGDFDDFDEQSGENVVLFDSQESYAPQPALEEEASEVVELEEEIVEDEVEEIDEIEEIVEEEATLEEDEIEEEEPENIVFMADDDDEEPQEIEEERVDMLGINEDLKSRITAELFDGVEDDYNQFVAKLVEFDDFDDAIIFIYESFPEKQGADSIVELADVVSENLNG